jgi:hypothetical protein
MKVALFARCLLVRGMTGHVMHEWGNGGVGLAREILVMAVLEIGWKQRLVLYLASRMEVIESLTCICIPA